ncbi:MAG: 23S rRNA (guanosine(2251)-2'-O)-methyltransferase RlmB [Thermodesulfobacteriota bacterium]
MKRLVYGINPVREALRGRGGRGAKGGSGGEVEKVVVSEGRCGRAAEEILKDAASKGIKVERVARKALDTLAGTQKHQGVLATLRGEYPYRDIEDLLSAWKESGTRAFFLVLDSIQDPQNLGSLVRTAHAAGVHGVITPKDRSAEVTAAVVKASAGATEHTRVARVTNLADALKRLKEEGVWVVGVEADSEEDIFTADLDRDLALVIGSEGKGIRRLVRERCDFCVSIPMAGRINSLNAAQAGAVALFEAKRQRGRGGNG